jgi:hypothetical protein
MRDGIVSTDEIVVSIETYAKGGAWSFSDGWPVQYTLIADAHSVPRFDLYQTREIDLQLTLHPNYAMGRPGGCEICVLGWVKFTSDAEREDINRLTQFDLSCLTRWHPCLTQSDLMPAAWAQYVAEHSQLHQTSDSMSCPPSIIEIIGRDSAHIAIGAIVEYHQDDAERFLHGIAKIRVLEKLKGVPDWKVGEIRDVPISPRPDQSQLKTSAGAPVILFAGWGPLREMRIDPSYNCPVLWANATNLTELRRGLAKDYTDKDWLAGRPQ